MKKIKQHPFFWSSVFAVVVVAVLDADTAVSLLLVYFFVGMFWLLVSAIKAAKQKYSKKTSPAKTTRRVAKHISKDAGSELSAQRDTFLYQKELGNVAYLYTDIGVYVPDVSRFNNPECNLLGVVAFAKEPNNTYDQNAVLVAQSDGAIGYMYRGRLQSMVNNWLDDGRRVFGYISYLNTSHPNANKDGLKIDIVFYE